jgi:hypothetical protein
MKKVEDYLILKYMKQKFCDIKRIFVIAFLLKYE